MADIAFTNVTKYQPTGSITRLLGVLSGWRKRAQERAELARLSGRDLRDMGITPAQADFEANKPFWQA